MLARKGTLNWFSVALRGILALISVVAIVSVSYVLASPMLVIGAASFLVLCRMLTANHCPINVQWRICTADWVRNGHSEEIKGVPGWIARFAAREDTVLCGICFAATFFSTMALMILYYSSSVALERPMWEQGTLVMSLLIPHLASLVVVYLRFVRNDLMDRVLALVMIEREEKESARTESMQISH